MLFFAIVLYTLSIHSVFSQEGIKLPDSKLNIIEKNISDKIFNIYVTKNKEIYANGNKIKIHELSKEINYYESILNKNYKQDNFFKIFLYADKRLNYSFIDTLKTEMAMSSSDDLGRNLYYKTGEVDNFKSGFNFFLEPNSFYHLSSTEIPLTNEEKLKKEKYMGEYKNMWGDVLPPMPAWWEDVIKLNNVIYSVQKDAINEILETKYPIHNCIIIEKKGVLIYKQEEISINEDVVVQRIIEENDLIFLQMSDNLTYGDYILAKQKIISLLNKLSKETKIATFLELSSEILKLHKRNSINICS